MIREGKNVKQKWFVNIDCIEELKQQYRALCKAHHPDLHPENPAATAEMQEINGEFEALFMRYKDIHRSTREDGPATYTAETPTAETPEDFINICTELFKLDGLEVELCGRWLWIGGETRKHKDRLKALGCKWSKKKGMWHFHYDEDCAKMYKGKREWSMEKIRNYWGSEALKESEKVRREAIPA